MNARSVRVYSPSATVTQTPVKKERGTVQTYLAPDKTTENYPCVNLNTSFVHQTSTVSSQTKKGLAFTTQPRDDEGEDLYATRLFKSILYNLEICIQWH